MPAVVSELFFRTFQLSFPALQNGRSQFVINGNWKISIPGEYNVAGTKLLYRRSADTWESFEVPGPTSEDLHLMVRLQVHQHRLDSGSAKSQSELKVMKQLTWKRTQSFSQFRDTVYVEGVLLITMRFTRKLGFFWGGSDQFN